MIFVPTANPRHTGQLTRLGQQPWHQIMMYQTCPFEAAVDQMRSCSHTHLLRFPVHPIRHALLCLTQLSLIEHQSSRPSIAPRSRTKLNNLSVAALQHPGQGLRYLVETALPHLPTCRHARCLTRRFLSLGRRSLRCIRGQTNGCSALCATSIYQSM